MQVFHVLKILRNLLTQQFPTQGLLGEGLGIWRRWGFLALNII
jgi:hypothetical protein